MQSANDDVTLLRAASQGNSAAFSLVLERHYPSLLRACLQLVGERAVAEDCAQDAAMVAWLRLPHLRSPEAFPAWLNGIGRHTCQHALRARTSAPTIDSAPAVADGSVHEVAVESDVRQALREAIDDLPPGCCAAVRAFYLGGLGYTDAAAALGISISALKVRLYSARQLLRHRFLLRDPAVRESPPHPRTLAIHEAAHAVLYCRYGRDLQRVSIAPMSAVWVARDSDGVMHSSQLPVLLDLQVRMAGEVATFLGRVGVSGGDRDEAGKIALHETGGDQVEAALLLGQAGSGARSVLESNRTWSQVERVAAALQQVRTVDGDDVRKLVSLAN